MSEEIVIRNGAPTLAGLKTASLFSCAYSSRKELTRFLSRLNKQLQGRGLRIVPLRISEDKALLYLYRPKKLCADIADAAASALLSERGYDTENCDRCVVQLMQNLRAGKDFPHEIGLFLGYPVEDVQGFIRHNARDFKCVGCWKVYGDEVAARRKFDQYKKCTRVYCEQWRKGKNIERLAVAG